MSGRFPFSPDRAALLLGVVAAVDVVVTLRSAGGIGGTVLPAALLLGIGVWLLLDRVGDHAQRVRGCAAMLLGAQLGMIVGLSLHFGSLGLVILSSWCSVTDTVGGAIRLMASVAPGMHIGMVAGGLIAAVLSVPLTVPRALVSLVLMTVSIPLADALAWGYVQIDRGGGVFMSLCHLFAMTLVMAVGTLAMRFARTRGCDTLPHWLWPASVRP
jgi:hypothetical protein